MIAPFYLTACPTGWVLANGTTYGSTGTPDLRDKYLMAGGTTFTANTSGGSRSYAPAGGVSLGYTPGANVLSTGANTRITATFTGTANTTAITPPYYALIYCVKT
jgi:hypothetical protein